MRRALAILLALAAAGCTSNHQLAACKGPLIALNAPQWRPTAAEMVALEKACPEDR